MSDSMELFQKINGPARLFGTIFPASTVENDFATANKDVKAEREQTIKMYRMDKRAMLMAAQEEIENLVVATTFISPERGSRIIEDIKNQTDKILRGESRMLNTNESLSILAALDPRRDKPQAAALALINAIFEKTNEVLEFDTKAHKESLEASKNLKNELGKQYTNEISEYNTMLATVSLISEFEEKGGDIRSFLEKKENLTQLVNRASVESVALETGLTVDIKDPTFLKRLQQMPDIEDTIRKYIEFKLSSEKLDFINTKYFNLTDEEINAKRGNSGAFLMRNDMEKLEEQAIICEIMAERFAQKGYVEKEGSKINLNEEYKKMLQPKIHLEIDGKKSSDAIEESKIIELHNLLAAIRGYREKTGSYKDIEEILTKSISKETKQEILPNMPDAEIGGYLKQAINLSSFVERDKIKKQQKSEREIQENLIHLRESAKGGTYKNMVLEHIAKITNEDLHASGGLKRSGSRTMFQLRSCLASSLQGKTSVETVESMASGCVKKYIEDSKQAGEKTLQTLTGPSSLFAGSLGVAPLLAVYSIYRELIAHQTLKKLGQIEQESLKIHNIVDEVGTETELKAAQLFFPFKSFNDNFFETKINGEDFKRVKSATFAAYAKDLTTFYSLNKKTKEEQSKEIIDKVDNFRERIAKNIFDKIFYDSGLIIRNTPKLTKNMEEFKSEKKEALGEFYKYQIETVEKELYALREKGLEKSDKYNNQNEILLNINAVIEKETQDAWNDYQKEELEKNLQQTINAEQQIELKSRQLEKIAEEENSVIFKINQLEATLDAAKRDPSSAEEDLSMLQSEIMSLIDKKVDIDKKMMSISKDIGSIGESVEKEWEFLPSGLDTGTVKEIEKNLFKKNGEGKGKGAIQTFETIKNLARNNPDIQIKLIQEQERAIREEIINLHDKKMRMQEDAKNSNNILEKKDSTPLGIVLNDKTILQRQMNILVSVYKDTLSIADQFIYEQKQDSEVGEHYEHLQKEDIFYELENDDFVKLLTTTSLENHGDPMNIKLSMDGSNIRVVGINSEAEKKIQKDIEKYGDKQREDMDEIFDNIKKSRANK